MPVSIRDYILITLAILVLGLSGYAVYTKDRLDAAVNKAAAANANAKAYEEYAAKAIELHKKKEKKYAEVQTVLEVNREWADLPLPDDVADLLRHPSGSTEAVP